MLDAQPAIVYPTSPDDLSRNSKFGFWSGHHCIYFLTTVLSTIVAVGMKFDLTCRQRNLSSTTALLATPPWSKQFPSLSYLSSLQPSDTTVHFGHVSQDALKIAFATEPECSESSPRLYKGNQR